MEFKKAPFLILILCLCFAGCGDSVSSKIKSSTKEHVRKVAIMYTVYTSANSFQGPKDEAELKDWILGDPQRIERLAKFGIDVDDFDAYMTSERTGDKLDVRWGLTSRPMAPPYPVAFEPVALDGIRLVGMAGGVTRKVSDDEEYDELWNGIVSETAEGEDPNAGGRGSQ